MNKEGRVGEQPQWSLVCKRSRLWEGRPQPGGLKSFLSAGGSDSGRVEYSGRALRFTGKKRQVEIPVISSISEVRANIRWPHLLLYFISLFAVLWLLNAPFRASTTGLLVAVTLALMATAFSWWYLRKYGGWVWINYASSGGQPKDIGLWGAPISGGSQRLYQTLSRLVTAPASGEN